MSSGKTSSYRARALPSVGVAAAWLAIAAYSPADATTSANSALLQTYVSFYHSSTGTIDSFANNGDGSTDIDQTYGSSVSSANPYAHVFSTVRSVPIATAASSGNNAGSVVMYSSFNYTITVNSMTANDATIVPISYMAKLSATNSGAPLYSDNSYSIARAVIRLSGSMQQDEYEALSCPNRCGLDSGLSGYNFLSGVGTANYSATGTLSERVNNQVSVFGQIGLDVGGSGTASGFADPYFFIDPSFAATHQGYSLAFSPYVGNDPTPGVPEPASWSLMLIGFGAVGWGVRRNHEAQIA
jgi:hypothetical protein